MNINKILAFSRLGKAIDEGPHPWHECIALTQTIQAWEFNGPIGTQSQLAQQTKKVCNMIIRNQKRKSDIS